MFIERLWILLNKIVQLIISKWKRKEVRKALLAEVVVIALVLRVGI